MPQIKHAERPGPELFIGLAGAVGTDLDLVFEALQRSLATVGYSTAKIHLAGLLRDLPQYHVRASLSLDQYIDRMMDAGDDFRAKLDRGDAVALLGVASLNRLRPGAPGKRGARERQAYIFRSLKHPAEVTKLRAIYGPSFYLLAAYTPEGERLRNLASRIARSQGSPMAQDLKSAGRLIRRDRAERDVRLGQSLEETFHLADVFVDARNRANLFAETQRFVELVFGNTFQTPTRAESAMFQASAAALRSGELGRQVGAAVVDGDGSVISVGTNEVPKAGGGLYWCDDPNDCREYTRGFDSSDALKRRLVEETLEYLKGAGWLARKTARLPPAELLRRAVEGSRPVLPKESMIRNPVEYGRAVHAEMAAITDAARRGVALSGATMYVTTFPCHLCARHIVAAGIRGVRFIEPYSRSLTSELLPDSVAVDSEPGVGKVGFQPFLGVAPRQFLQLFAALQRKDKFGMVLPFDGTAALPRSVDDTNIYLLREKAAAVELATAQHWE